MDCCAAIGLVVAEVPLRVVALEVVLGEGGGGVACGVEADARVNTLLARDDLRHDTEGAVSQLLNTPELLVSTGVGRNGCNLAVGGSGQCALCTFNHNLEVGITKVSTLTLYRADGPALMGTEHIVADTGRNIALGPCADNLIQCLVSHGLWGSSILLRSATESTEAAGAGYVHANEIDGQLKGIAATL